MKIFGIAIAAMTLAAAILFGPTASLLEAGVFRPTASLLEAGVFRPTASLLEARAADAPKVTVTPVARTNKTITGQPIVVPERPDVIVAIATLPPGARLPEHKHTRPHYVYVLEGVLTVVDTETNQTFTVKKGDFVVEMLDTWHYGINNGTVPVKLLAIDQVTVDVTSNMVLKTP